MRRDAPPAAFLRALRGRTVVRTGAVLCLLLGCVGLGGADCGKGLDEIERAVGIELAELRVDAETAREADALTEGSETAFHALYRYRPEEYPPRYDAALHRQVRTLHRNVVAPKRQRLSRLRDRAAAAYRAQERQVRQDQTKFFEAAALVQDEGADRSELCRARAAYAAGMNRYRAELVRYRAGLKTYTTGLDAYREQFLGPAMRGYRAPAVWTALVARFESETAAERAEFLQTYIDALEAGVEAAAPSDGASAAAPSSGRSDESPAP